MSTSGVIGTAGHIDHGKTALVRALTGIDTDRLKEEKERGITIELGFAHLRLPSGRTVGVVDVPGHERFVRAMVAGAVGMDLVVLVIAADEGVMPQTREHLDICQLLGIGRGLVALTKIDAVESGLRALALADVEEALAGTFLASAPIIPCSAHSGEGLPELRSAIETMLDAPRSTSEWPVPPRDVLGPARMPIDRVFTMKGFGSVVTGTLWSGQLHVGDEVELYPSDGTTAKLRGIQVHGGAVESAEAGRRVAVNVPLPRETLERGTVLGRAGELEAGRIFDAELRCLSSARRPLKKRSRVLLHSGTTQVEATVRLLDREILAPGARTFVEIETDDPLIAYPGDRFILRGFQLQRGYGTTVGGGVVVRVLGARSRRGARTEPALLQRNLAAQVAGDAATRVLLEIERADIAGLDRASLGRRVAFVPRAIDTALGALASRRAVVRFDRERDAYIAAGALAALETCALEAVAKQHQLAPLESGVPREALRALVHEDARLLHTVVEALVAQGKLLADRDRVRLPGHDPGRTTSRSGIDELGEKLFSLIDAAGLSPARPVDLATTIAIPAREVDRALEILAQRGRLVRMKELYFAATHVTALRQKLIATLQAEREISPARWKELCGASRKYTIPLAEYFDAEKVTLRVGDQRRLR